MRRQLIGYGRQGYLFHPPLTIAAAADSLNQFQWLDRNPQFVMKVMIDEVARREVRQSCVLTRIDPERERFLVFEGVCEESMEKKGYRLTVEQHQALERFTGQSFPATSLAGYPIRYGGIPYQTRMRSYVGRDWTGLWEEFSTLLQSLHCMHHQAKIVHRDLKSTNIVFHPRTEQVRLIDFGLGVDLEELLPGRGDVHAMLGESKFEIWSIDLNARCAEFRMQSDPSSAMWHWIQHGSARPWSLWLNYWKLDTAEETERWYRQYIDECFAFWRQDDRVIDVAVVRTMLQQGDVMQLALMFLDFLVNQYLPSFGDQRTVPHLDSLMRWIDQLLVPMIHPDYRHRLTTDQAVERESVFSIPEESAAKAAADQPQQPEPHKKIKVRQRSREENIWLPPSHRMYDNRLHTQLATVAPPATKDVEMIPTKRPKNNGD